MNARLTKFRGHQDGIRWGRLMVPDAEEHRRYFAWHYDCLGDRLRIFADDPLEPKEAEEVEDPELSAQVRHLVRERMGRAA